MTQNISPGNGSSVAPTLREFQCCCSIPPEEYYANGTTVKIYILSNIVLVPSSILATLGNLLVLVSIWRTPSLHSPSNVLLFGLAVSDLGVGLVAEPVLFVRNIAKLEGLMRIFCSTTVAIRFLAPMLCFASLFTITAISLDMYIALYLHLRYQEIVTVKRIIEVLVGIWMCSITAGLLFIWYKKDLEILWMFIILLCLLVTTSSYAKVFTIVRHHQKEIHAQAQVQQAEDQDKDSLNIAQHRKSLVNKFVVYCLLVFCYLPFAVMTVVITKDFSVSNVSFYEMSVVLVCFNSTLNPFVFCWRFQNIRAAVIETTKKLF